MLNWRNAVSICAMLVMTGCATAARITLNDRLRAIGIGAATAECLVGELDQRLSDEDLQELARYTLRLARADSTVGAIRSLMTIDNPRAITAIGASGVACVTGLRL